MLKIVVQPLIACPKLSQLAGNKECPMFQKEIKKILKRASISSNQIFTMSLNQIKKLDYNSKHKILESVLGLVALAFMTI